jgi:hypothetical protein
MSTPAPSSVSFIKPTAISHGIPGRETPNPIAAPMAIPTAAPAIMRVRPMGFRSIEEIWLPEAS